MICSSCARKRATHNHVKYVTREELKISKQSEHKENDGNTYPSLEKNTSSYELSRLINQDKELIIPRLGYTISYNSKTKLANWVAWHLTKEHTNGPYSRKGVPYYDESGTALGIGVVTSATNRGVYFIDTMVDGEKQDFCDWTTAKDLNLNHGHLCPAADNRWSKEAMNQSFLLTNICPQDIDLNAGDWEKLEKKCRLWANFYGDVYIVAGPVFFRKEYKTMGNNHVGIPDAFFKVILCMKDSPKALGFLFPNKGTSQPLKNYLATVDSLEMVSGIDFFYNLPDDIENVVEKSSDIHNW